MSGLRRAPRGEVTVAVDGRDALQAYERGSFDVILMDCQMPEMDGYDCTRTIRLKEAALGCHVPIIALTANAMKGDAEKCYEAGMDAYISKPYKAAELKEMLTKWATARSAA